MNSDDQQIENTIITDQDDQKLINAFTQALIKYDEIKEQEYKDKKKAESEEFKKRIGLKDNKFALIPFIKLLLRPKYYLNVTTVNSSLIAIIVQMIYSFCEILFFTLSIFCIAYIPIQFTLPFLPILKWYYNIILAIWAFGFLIISRFFRVIVIKVDSIKDESKLYNMFGVFISLISLVLAIISVVLAVIAF